MATDDGRPVVPILPVKTEFVRGLETCSRTQFPLIISYAITVYKFQSITVDKVVTDLSERDFQSGHSYVALSHVKTIEGLMLDAPFAGCHLYRDQMPEGMQVKFHDQERRQKQALYEALYGPPGSQL